MILYMSFLLKIKHYLIWYLGYLFGYVCGQLGVEKKDIERAIKGRLGYLIDFLLLHVTFTDNGYLFHTILDVFKYVYAFISL